MVVPDSQDGKQISAKMTMDRDEGSQDTVPVFHRTAGSNHFIPSLKELCHHRPPSRYKISGQFLGLWLQDRSPLPCPAANLARALLTNTCSIHCKKKRSESRKVG